MCIVCATDPTSVEYFSGFITACGADLVWRFDVCESMSGAPMFKSAYLLDIIKDLHITSSRLPPDRRIVATEYKLTWDRRDLREATASDSQDVFCFNDMCTCRAAAAAGPSRKERIRSVTDASAVSAAAAAILRDFGLLADHDFSDDEPGPADGAYRTLHSQVSLFARGRRRGRRRRGRRRRHRGRGRRRRRGR